MKTLGTTALIASFLLAAGLATGCADGLDTGTTQSEVANRPRFDLWKTGSQFYFHLQASNGEIILASEGYSNRTGALNGILSVLDNGGIASRYDVKDASNGGAYFNLLAANKQVIGTSEVYASTSNAKAGVDACVRNVAAYLEAWDTATGARFDVFEGRDGRFYFNLHAGNGEIVLHSQGYDTEASALNGAFSVSDNGVTKTNYDIKAASGGGYYFNLKSAANGQVIGTSEVYSTKSNATRGRDAIVALLPSVELL